MDTCMDKGAAINQCAFLASQILSLREHVKKWEKDSRRTPPKTLIKEKEKVRQAKINVEVGKQKLAEMWEELVSLSPTANWWPSLLGPKPQ